MASSLDGGGWSTSHSGLFYPRERHSTHCTVGWVGPRASLERCRKSRPPPGFNYQTFQSVVSCHTNYTILAHLLKVAPCKKIRSQIRWLHWKSHKSSKKLGIITVDSLRMSHLAPSCWQSPWGRSHYLQFNDSGMCGSLTRYGALNSDFLWIQWFFMSHLGFSEFCEFTWQDRRNQSLSVTHVMSSIPGELWRMCWNH
jgi:hypothetical protein